MPTQASEVWRTAPRRSIVLFLAAVFCVFCILGIANDIMNMGRQPPIRYATQVLLTGLFAVVYASIGISRRFKFVHVFLPLMVLQFFLSGLLNSWLPERPHPLASAAGIAQLQRRLVFDGISTIVAVSLGYAGFVTVFVSEGRRYVRTNTEKVTLETEMAAASEVQRVMVPEALPRVEGYSIDSVYRPAAQVGGDFFQVVPLPSGRAFILIGDVSGKGLRAAMVVSMIIGTVRTVSGFTEQPEEVLAELNRLLYGRISDGFVTCLAVRLEPEGRITFANAGHLPPYCNGKEIETPGALPLGLIETATYTATPLTLAPQDVLDLLTDGVAEAQDPQHALLGFDRVQQLLRRPGATARDIADAAQHHGQQDDITILRINRTA